MLYMHDNMISSAIIQNKSSKSATPGEAKWGKINKWQKEESDRVWRNHLWKIRENGKGFF